MPSTVPPNVQQAIKTLDLPPNEDFTVGDVQRRHRARIRHAHPDVAGGSTRQAQKINAARDLLIEWIEAGKPLRAEPPPAPPEPPTRPEYRPPPLRRSGKAQEIISGIAGFAILAAIAWTILGEVFSPIRLTTENVVPIDMGSFAGPCWRRVPVTGVCARLKTLVDSRQYWAIQCLYRAPESDKYWNFVIWADRVPENVRSYIITGSDADHAFRLLGKIAITKCPATKKEMEKIYQAGRISNADWPSR